MRIKTNIEKLYIKGEKSGSETVTLTSSYPISISIDEYTKDLIGSVSYSIDGNETTNASITFTYSNLYVNGETYSANITAYSDNDVLTIPVIINCSDTLIYTNIPNNIIDDIYNDITITYSSLPEVNDVVITYNNGVEKSVINSVSSGELTLSKEDLQNISYITASNGLSQITTSVLNNTAPQKNYFKGVFVYGCMYTECRLAVKSLQGRENIVNTQVIKVRDVSTGEYIPVTDRTVYGGYHIDGVYLNATFTYATIPLTYRGKLLEITFEDIDWENPNHPPLSHLFLHTDLLEIKRIDIDWHLINNLDYAFSAYNLDNIPTIDCTNIKSMRSTVYDATKLTKLGGFHNLKVDIDLSRAENLTYDSLMNVINNLAKVDDTPKLILGEKNLSKLSESEIFIAIRKGWNVVGFEIPVFRLENITNNPIYIKSSIPSLTQIQFISTKNNIEYPVNKEDITLSGGLSFNDLTSDGKGVYTLNVFVEGNESHEVAYHSLSIRQNGITGVKIIKFEIYKSEYVDVYVFDSKTKSPIYLTCREQDILLQFISTKNNIEYQINEEDISLSKGLSIKSLTSDGDGLYDLNIHIEENLQNYNLRSNVTIKQGTSSQNNSLSWSITQDAYISLDDEINDLLYKDEFEYDENAPSGGYWLCKYEISQNDIGTPIKLFTCSEHEKNTIKYAINGVTFSGENIKYGDEFDFEWGTKVTITSSYTCYDIVNEFDSQGIYTIRIPYFKIGDSDYTVGLFAKCENLISCAAINASDYIYGSDETGTNLSSKLYATWDGTFYKCHNLKYFGINYLNCQIDYNTYGNAYSYLGLLKKPFDYTFYDCHKLSCLYKTIEQVGGTYEVKTSTHNDNTYRGFEMNYTFYNCYEILSEDANLFTNNPLFISENFVESKTEDYGEGEFLPNEGKASIFENCKKIEYIKYNTAPLKRCFSGCDNLKEMYVNWQYHIRCDDFLPNNGLHGNYHCKYFDIIDKDECIKNGWNYIFDEDRIIPYDDIDNGGKIRITTKEVSNGSHTILNLKNLDYEVDYCNFPYSKNSDKLIVQVDSVEGYSIIEAHITLPSKYIGGIHLVTRSGRLEDYVKTRQLLNSSFYDYDIIEVDNDVMFVEVPYFLYVGDTNEVHCNPIQPYLINACGLFYVSRDLSKSKPTIIKDLKRCNCTNMYEKSGIAEVVGMKCFECDITGMFRECKSLKTLDIDIKGSYENAGYDPYIDFDFIYNCVVLENLSKLDISRAPDVSWAGPYFKFKLTTVALKNFGGFYNAGCTIDVSACTLLTRESLMNIINNITAPLSDDWGNLCTLTLGEANLAKLTDDEIVIAINKGWTIS